MTERDWLEGTDPEAMLLVLRGRCSARKLRLFACACCRRIWHLLGDERSRNAVELSERYADGHVDAAELQIARSAAKDVLKAPHGINIQAARSAIRAAAQDPVDESDTLFWYAVRVGTRAARAAIRPQEPEARAQADFLRDIFGNPFRPLATLDAASKEVAELARRIYDDRLFEKLPLLAEALEAARCRDAALLDHCRLPEGHVRGCWFLDGLLGMK